MAGRQPPATSPTMPPILPARTSARPPRGENPRPSPDALLKAAEKEARGKLKIFLGAAPGVGRTYEMMTAARRRKVEGVDVVVGLVETHGRAETEAQLVGLEVVPRHTVE